MNPGKTLFNLAFAFKQSKIWKKVFEDELFAVDLDGEIGYCSLMGRNGQHTALAVYVGDQGFSSLRYLQEIDPGNITDLLSQDCVQCSLEKREEFTPEELAAIQAYCKEAGLSFRAPFPQFSRYYPNCVPTPVTDKADWQHLRTALRVVNALAELLQDHTKEELGLRSIVFDTAGEAYAGAWMPSGALSYNPRVTIPLYRLKKYEIQGSLIPLPPYSERLPMPPTHVNEIALSRLKKLPQAGVYQCRIIRVPEPVEGKPPYLPALLLAVDEDTGLVLEPATAEGANYDSDALLNEFLTNLVSQKVYPAAILVNTEETRVLLADFCAKAGIRLEITEDLPELEEAIDAMNERFHSSSTPRSLDEVFARLNQLSVSELADLPEAMLTQLRMLAAAGQLPDALRKKLAQIPEH